jgi:FixJ family two-component response regulator
MENAEQPTVFLVDDDAAVLGALSRLLRVKGYQVQAFESAEGLLEHWTPALPGCLVLDVSLPGSTDSHCSAGSPSRDMCCRSYF